MNDIKGWNVLMKKTFNKKSYTTIFIFICLAIFFSLGSMFVPFSKRLDFNDSSIYQYIGYIICKGKTPYIDVFDHKGIYFYFFNALGYTIDSKWGMWPLIVSAVFADMFAVYHLARKFLVRKRAFVIAVLIGSSISCTFWDGDTPDFFALLFCILSFNALSEFFIKEDLSKKNILLAGCFSAVAFWMKPNMIAGTLVICGCIIVTILYQKKFKLAGICLVGYFLGFIAASIPAIIWLWAHGALRAMAEDYFLFNFVYSGFSATNDARITAFSFYITYPLSIAVVVCILIFLVLLLKYQSQCENPELGLFICGIVSFVICLIHAAMTGNSYTQYMMLLYPSMAYIFISLILYVSKIYQDKAKLVSTVAILCVACVLILNARLEYKDCVYFWTAVPQEDEEIEYIKDNSDTGDTIAVVSPYYSGMYIASGRDSATKYVYVQANHFVNMEDNPEEERDYWNEYVEMLINNKPRIIVYDNGFTGNDAEIKSILQKCLKDYQYAGSSAYKDFYVLPRFDNEEIPDFIPITEVDTSLMSVTMPEEVMEQYRNGEITLDEAMEIIMDEYDEQIKNGGK